MCVRAAIGGLTRKKEKDYVEGEVLDVEEDEQQDAGETRLESQHDAGQQEHADDLDDDPRHRVEPCQRHEHQ